MSASRLCFKMTRSCQAAGKLCWHAGNSMVRTCGRSPVYLVDLVCFVYLVSFVQLNKQDKPNEQGRLVDFFSILLEAVNELAGHRIAIRHILYEGGKLTKGGRAFLQENQPDLCIFDHTHQPRVEWFGKTLLFNFGSAGPQRFTLPRAVGTLEMIDGKIKSMHIELKKNPSRKRPGKILGGRSAEDSSR